MMREDCKKFWVEQLKDFEPEVQIAFDNVKIVRCTQTYRWNYMISGQSADIIAKMAQGAELSEYVLILSLFIYTLNRFSDKERTHIAIPPYDAGKTNKTAVQPCLLVLPFYTNEEENFQSYVIRVREKLIEAYNHQNGAKDILEDIIPEGMDEIYANMVLASKRLHGDLILAYPANILITYDIKPHTLEFSIEISDAYEKESVQRLLNAFTVLMDAIVIKTDQPLKTFDVYKNNRTGSEIINKNGSFVNEQSLIEIFEKHAEENSAAIALIQGDSKMTYGVLREKVKQFAALLQKNGVKAESVVAVMLNRSFDMIIAIYAILKAGCAYLPIDPTVPAERVRFLLKDSNAEILVTQRSIYDKYQAEVKAVMSVNNILIADELKEQHEADQAVRAEYGKVCCIIYTSGSTGVPKGVVVHNKGIVNVLEFLKNQYNMDENSTLMLKCNYTFDVSLTEIFGFMFCKGKLVLLEDQGEKDTECLYNTIVNYSVTHINFVPSAFEAFCMYLEKQNISGLNQLRFIWSAGEMLSTDTVTRFYKRVSNTAVINLYGPTEATIFNTYYDTRKFNSNRLRVPIGQPLPDTRILIMDRKHRIQPVGGEGTLFIGGTGLSQGYLNNAELTQEKFIEHPYQPGIKIYNTGDIAKMNGSEEIEFLSRCDSQIKRRGYRIEAGEIEIALKQVKGVHHAYVVYRKFKNEAKYLCGYIIADDPVKELEVMEAIKRILPGYMLPDFIIKIDNFSYTGSGKIDSRNLPEPFVEVAGEEQNEYAGLPLAKEVLSIYSNVLGITRLSLKSEFFSVGGDSLSALSILSKVETSYGVRVKLEKFYELKTIGGLVGYIQKSNPTEAFVIPKITEKEYYETSSAQKRIYILQQMNPGSTNYNMPFTLKLTGKVDFKKIKAVFTALYKRHEAFRTTFILKENELYQQIHEDLDFYVDYMELDENTPVNSIIDLFIQPFQLDKGPLLRVLLIKQEPEDYYLLVDMHHIISDGTSMKIVIDEFARLYTGDEPDEINLSYKDYALWHNRLVESDEIKEAQQFWLDMFKGELPNLNLPADYIRLNEPDNEGGVIKLVLGKKQTELLYIWAKQFQTTPYILLMSIYIFLLSEYTGQQDVVLGYPAAGRVTPDIENIIGMFVNTLVIRVQLEHAMSFTQLLSTVKQYTLKMHEMQNYPFDMLVEKLRVERNASNNVLFETMFSHRDTYFTRMDVGDITIEKWEYNSVQTKFDLYYNVEFYPGEIILETVYRRSLFLEETILNLNRCFQNLIEEIIRNPYKRLCDYSMLSADEADYMINELCGSKEQLSFLPLQRQFEVMADRYPDKTALSYKHKKLTYHELNAAAGQIAGKILALAEQGSIIGIYMSRSLEMIVAILSILKAGCSYLPLDTDNPQERIDYILKDCNCSLVLTQAQYTNLIDSKVSTVPIDIENIAINEGISSESTYSNKIACIMYTSGSTGKPKGSMITHDGISRITVKPNYMNISEDDVFLQLSTYVFDGSLFEIFGALLNGGRLVMLDKTDILDFASLSAIIKEERITVFFITTSLFNLLIDNELSSLANIRHIFVGGERVSPTHIKKAYDFLGKGKVVVVYGPTESTIYTSAYPVAGNVDIRRNIPIGRPVSGTQVLILNQERQPVPYGAIGELCIAGQGLSEGYLNQPQLTSELFVKHPYNEGQLIYRSGDLARWLPDGNIDFIGRKDNQLKIRGNRVEIGEIENVIETCPGIREVAVIPYRDSLNTIKLCAFVSFIEKADKDALIDYLHNRLPDYMMPSLFHVMEALPVNANGKIDRKSLSGLQLEKPVTSVKQTGETESEIKRIWSSILQSNCEDVDTDFFSIGGNSLLAISLQVELGKRFPKAESINVYQYKTIAEQAGHIRSMYNENKL